MALTAKLTKPQAALLAKAMRARQPVAVQGAERRVAGRLSALGYGTIGQTLFAVDRAGLEALLYDRQLVDVRRGSIATMSAVEEVRAALENGAVSA